MGVFGLDLWCCPSSVGYLWCSWLGFGFGLLLGRVWFRGRPACPPPFPVPARGVGVCAGPGSRLCPVRLGWVVGVCFFFFAFWFFLFFFFFFLGFVVPVPPSPFFRAGLVPLFFFFFLSLFPVVRCYWLGVAGFGWVVRLGLCGGPPPPFFFFFFFFFFSPGGGGGWPPVVVLAGGWAAVGCFRAFSPSPLLFFFFFGGGLACSSLCLPWAGARTGLYSVLSSGLLFSVAFCVAIFPAPWVGWALYTVGSAPLLAGLGPGFAGWAAAPGGCLWFWVRGLGLLVSLPLCGAGCNLLGGPSPLSPGALWSRVWPVVLVCGVVARRLPGCAVAGFG